MDLMEGIYKEVNRELKTQIGNDDMIALAFTGSRAAGYNHDESDYDFFAIFK